MSSGSSCLELLLTQTLLAIVLLDFFCFQLGNTNALSMKPFITFVTTAVKKKTNCYTISNPFLFAQFKYSMVSGMHTKQNFEILKKKKQKLDFFFVLFSFSLFLFHFFPSLLAFTRLYEVKVSQELLKKVKFFNKKWQVVHVGRPDFPLILPVKSDRFFTFKSGPIHKRALPFGHFLEGFFLLLELGTKDIFYHKKR